MTIYMKIPCLHGNTTAAGYEGWNVLNSFEFGASRLIGTSVGNVYNRVRSSARASEMWVTKPLDQSSPQLFTQACVGKAIDEIKIDVCKTANALNPYAQFTLHNVIVSRYGVSIEKAVVPMEIIGLNFTAIETRYTPHDGNYQPQAPITAKMNVGSKQSIGVKLCQHIQDPTQEGFNIFVATVYGEVGGVNVAKEAIWQGVGSVIINRVGQGIWHRYLTTASVIEHTGFDAFMSPCNIPWDKMDLYDNKHHPHQQFLKALATLKSQHINHKSAMINNEKAVLMHMKDILYNVYFQKKVTIDANYYYSPQAMKGKTPTFLKYIKNYEQYRIYVPGSNENEIKFYKIPASVERAAGAKR